jgi:GDP-L-fucose synthase
MKINKNSKIFIAGHKGMVGSAIKKKLEQKGFKNIIIIEKKKLNLIEQKKVFNYLKKIKPNLVILAAAKVGGIVANNSFKSQFIYENLQIQNNIIHGSFKSGVKNLIFLGSSCIYPKLAKQPIKEDYLLTGNLEKTNDAYAIAKIAGIMMCKNYSKSYGLNYKCLMPSNMYGPNDNYDLQNSHFFPALIRKIYEAKIFNKKTVKVWGSGKVLRELLYVDDFADAVVFFLNKNIKQPFINIGSGKDYKISWYTKFIMTQLGIKLKIVYDRSKPDGVPRKLLDVSLAKKYGWTCKTSLKEGLYKTLLDFKSGYRK